MIGEFKNSNKTAIGNAFTTVYTAPADGAYLIQFDICNVDTAGVNVSVKVVSDSGAIEAYQIKDVPLPNGATLSVLSGQKLVLESGDYIQAKCETTGKTIDVICSLVANVNG